jgi:hypothetical protein
MSNTLLTINQITRKALVVLHQNLNFVGNIDRQHEASFGNAGKQIGDSIRIRLPNQYTVRTGAALAAQDTVEQNTTLQVATHCSFRPPWEASRAIAGTRAGAEASERPPPRPRRGRFAGFLSIPIIKCHRDHHSNSLSMSPLLSTNASPAQFSRGDIPIQQPSSNSWAVS